MIHERYICPVGQGGFSIEKIEDYVVAYDCGSATSPQMVERCVDYLALHVDHMDILFISHFDNDHVNSLRYLLNKVRVHKAVTTFIPKDLRTAYSIYTDGAYSSIMSLLEDKERGIELDELGEKEKVEKRYGFHDIWEWIAKSMMTADDFTKVATFLQLKGIIMERLNHDPDYLESKKDVINDSFKTVFGSKGPNAKGLIMISQRCKGVVTNLCVIHQGCEWCHKYTSRLASSVSSCLYVGDSDLKNRSNKKEVKHFLCRYKTEDSLLIMQIPHHGSKYNVGVKFETDFSASYYFVNDITIIRLQKNTKLYNSLIIQKKLMISGDSCQSVIATETEIK